MSQSRTELKGLAVQVRSDILPNTPFTIEEDPNLGLYLCAKRLIKTGEVLYSDPALISVPCSTIDDVTWETPLCLGCCVLMKDDSRCSVCNWPLCSENCVGRANHLDNECAVFFQCGSVYPPEDPTVSLDTLYAVVQLIRGLRTSSVASQMTHTLQWNDSDDIDVKGIKDLLGLPVEFGSDSEWRRNHGIFIVNTHSSTFSDNTNLHCVQCLFPLYSFCNHSCSPNCEWAICCREGSFSLDLNPIVDILPGQPMTISYMPAWNVLGNCRRGKKITENLNFSCGCERCRDSSEFGSYFDAFICFNCGQGSMVPCGSEWKCEQCQYGVPTAFGENFTKLIWGNLSVTKEKWEEGESNEKEAINDLETFLEMYSGTYLHPNHNLLAEAASILAQLYQDKKTEGLNQKQSSRLVNLGQYLVNIWEKIAPGVSLLRRQATEYLDVPEN